MMDPSKKQNFEEQLKQFFEEASATPPKSVWARIEAHLDDEDDKIIPVLWWRSPKLWMAAASLAALLLVGGGIWYKASKDLPSSNISRAGNTDIDKSPAHKPTDLKPKSEAYKVEEDLIATDKIVQNSGISKSQDGSAASLKSLQHKNSRSVTVVDGYNSSKKNALTSDNEIKNQTVDVGDLSKTLGQTGMRQNAIAPAVSEAPNGIQKLITPSLLTINPVKDLEVLMQQRYVFFKPDEGNVEEPVKAHKKEYWAGVSFMPASFNPDLGLKAPPELYQSMNLASKAATIGGSKPGTSFAYQSYGGVNLTKRWSLEMGLNYLKGNSTYEGGGYLLSSTVNGLTSNVLEAAIMDAGNANNSHKSAAIAEGFTSSSSNLYINVNNEIANNYQYMQVPIQAGYTIFPNGKWNMAVLGGMVSNLFLKNELESTGGSFVTTRPGDNVYRTIYLSATSGLRLQYALSEKWKASLTGSYQKALNSGIRTNETLDAKPSIIGVAWGVRYTF